MHIEKCTYFSVIFFFGHTHSMQKFPGLGSNPSHSSDLSSCSDNTRSLTGCTTGELLIFDFYICLEFSQIEVFRNTSRNYVTRVPLWRSKLRIQCCHYSGLGHSCGSGLIPGLGTSTCHEHGQKKKKKKKRERERKRKERKEGKKLCNQDLDQEMEYYCSLPPLLLSFQTLLTLPAITPPSPQDNH